ncbi:hypothetical protein ACFVY4_14635 [Streptomyces sp. NPDC058299]|uniref:hypothetical protein n=1 Tax=Streptomyces sp. NPDC058299 TaxID=3346435 RepID=UPI0036E84D40
MSPSATRAVRAAAATELTYRLPGGATMSTIVPPRGFRPQTAAPATARAYGFDAPDSPKALAAWRTRYDGWRETVPSVPCVGPSGRSALRFATTYSSNWGGYTATGHSNYNEVYDDQNIPTYYTSCGPAGSTLAAPWIGLGGARSSKLIQQGFASGSSVGGTIQGASLWYEYLNAQHQNPPVYIGHTTRTGHVISQYMTYGSGRVGFHWYDRTAGAGWSPVNVSGLSGYYDGTTADYINERVYGVKLRKFSRQTFSAAGARYGSTFKDLFKLPSTEVRLTSNGVSSGAALLTDTRSSSSAFYQTWKRCS